MSRRLLALVLILLQGVAALPARFSLCLEPTGEICCIDGGAGRCCSDAKPPQAETAKRHACCGGHEAACDGAPPKSDDVAPQVSAVSPEHQHVDFSLFDVESTRSCREQVQVDGGDPAPAAALSPLAGTLPAEIHGPALSEARRRGRAARSISFSLFARASSVLRC